jgi:hypothetical protein
VGDRQRANLGQSDGLRSRQSNTQPEHERRRRQSLMRLRLRTPWRQGRRSGRREAAHQHRGAERDGSHRPDPGHLRERHDRSHQQRASDDDELDRDAVDGERGCHQPVGHGVLQDPAHPCRYARGQARADDGEGH